MNEQPQPTREELISLAVQQAALASEGSFSDRNPTLGRMKKCPYCGHRRRENDLLPCCTAKYFSESTSAVAVPKNNTGKRRNYSFATKTRKIPRLSRNRDPIHHAPLFEIHQRLAEIERTLPCRTCGKLYDDHEDGKCYADDTKMFIPLEQEGISGIVEAQIKRRKKDKARKVRNQQRLSRRMNRR